MSFDPILNTQVQRVGRKGAWNRTYTSGSIAAGAYSTILNITGRGYLLYVSTAITGVDGTSQSQQVRITIDGGTPGTIGLATGSYLYAFDAGTNRGGKLFVLDAQFTSSLKVEIYNPTASSITATSEVEYILGS